MSSGAATVNRWRAFALLAVAYFTTVIDLTIVNVSLPTIGRDLHFSATSLQWVVTAYGITFGGLLLFGGRAADLLGRRRIFAGGLAVFTAASLCCAVAGSEAFLIASRAVQGVGAALMLPAGLSIVMNMFAQGAERNKALGIWGGVGAGGGTVRADRRRRHHALPGLAVHLLPERPDRSFGARPHGEGCSGEPQPREQQALRATLPGRSAAPRRRSCCWSTRCPRPLSTAGVRRARSGYLRGSRSRAAACVPGDRGARASDPISAACHLPPADAGCGEPVAGLLLGASFYAFVFAGTLYMPGRVLHYSALQTGLAWLSASLMSMALAGVSQLLVTRGGTCMGDGRRNGDDWRRDPMGHPGPGQRAYFLANLAGPMATSPAREPPSRSSRSL